MMTPGNDLLHPTSQLEDRSGESGRSAWPATTNALVEALQHYEARRLVQAEASCRQVLQVEPKNSKALHLLGCVMLLLGRSDIAASLIRMAITMDPSVSDFHVSHGNALLSQGKANQAVASFQHALTLAPDAVKVYRGLGAALQELGRLDEAMTALRQFTASKPQDAGGHFDLANILLESGDLNQAMDSYERALEVDATFANAHLTTSTYYYRCGNIDRAAKMLQWGLQLDPENVELTFMLSAFEGKSYPERAPDEYITKHFDRYADTFDDKLIGTLRYTAPNKVLQSIEPFVSNRLGQLDVFDAGCGTGLCGPLLRPLARRLTGIDLSLIMLEKARARNVYDDLYCGELCARLGEERSSFDLIVSTDVLIYFGDLIQVFRAFSGALCDGGVLGISVERYDGHEYTLQTCGRYAHSSTYLREVASIAGLVELEIKECELRLEAGEPVHGYIGVFLKS